MHKGDVKGVTDRSGIINMHSLIWDQFNSPAYHDMLRYAWHNTDIGYDDEELHEGSPPHLVQDVQFDFNTGQRCEHQDCSDYAFIRCSHCRRHLCIKHFLERICFHHEAGHVETSTTQSATTTEQSTTELVTHPSTTSTTQQNLIPNGRLYIGPFGPIAYLTKDSEKKLRSLN